MLLRESRQRGQRLGSKPAAAAAAAAAAAKSLQSCLTLCDPIDSSPPGSPIPGILQAKPKEALTEQKISKLLSVENKQRANQVE